MARLKFLGFDLQGNGVPCVQNSTHEYVACDPGTQFCGKTSDTDFHTPEAGTLRVGVGNGRTAGTGLGYSAYLNSQLDSNAPHGVAWAACATMLKSSIGNIDQVWCSFDVFLTAPGNSFFNVTLPSTWMVSDSRWQLFKYGDLSLRLKSVTGAGLVGYYNVVFAAYNASTHLGDVSVPGLYLLAGYWVNVRVRAKLASGSAGEFQLLIGGVSATYSGLDTVSATSFADVDRLWFSGGGLREPASGPNSYRGVIDNILIDDAAWPTGRPVVAVVSSGFSDTSITGWTATAGGTISNAVLSVDSNRARGTGGGARAILDIPAPTMTSWNSALLGYQVVPGLLSNLDNVYLKRLKTGVRFGGTDRFGSVIQNITPPFQPDRLQNCGTETVFYNGGTTDFLKADVANTDVVLEVTP